MVLALCFDNVELVVLNPFVCLNQSLWAYSRTCCISTPSHSGSKELAHSLARIPNLGTAKRHLHDVQLIQAVILVWMASAGSLYVAIVSASEVERE